MAECFTCRKFSNHFTILEMEETFEVFLNVISSSEDSENAGKLPFKCLI